ncbi:polysaccharide lyase family 8 super-sandwich domain-containing protein [Vibrio maritimus]|uniref:polysaccharide lyase family 8 super-sandwich domain-containing protein n=1 Tax=Vibrio maritimus TaxID=990268 RepID=UPI001F165923|nr:polysaccharide lyase family 8 super-sandwich domain-containing protein [Vibrio maritimus]
MLNKTRLACLMLLSLNPPLYASELPFMAMLEERISTSNQVQALSSADYAHEYFDIDVNAKAGDVVYGRLNHPLNYKPSHISGTLHYEILGSENAPFEIRNQRDDKGRLFAELVLSERADLSMGQYPIPIALKDGETTVESRTITVHVVSETQWSQLHQRAMSFLEGEKRLQGLFVYADDEIEDYIQELNDNDGAFEGMDFYHAHSEDELLDIRPRVLGKELMLAANQINSLAYALTYSDQFGYQGEAPERKRLMRALYKAINRYTAHFPLKDFANTPTLMRNMSTHQWRFTDPISAAGFVMSPAMNRDIANGESLAKRAKASFQELLQIAFDIPYRQRQPEYNRYYLSEDLKRSPGAWADANRHHRMRSWLMMSVLWSDYNQPLTYQPWWYGDYAPFAAHNTSLLPGWTPKGALVDLKTWLETNARYAFKYGQSGILPDGTISHHVGVRQDMAFFAYGFEWMANTPFEVAGVLADTPWKLTNKSYDQSADFLLDSYPNFVYRGGLDFQTAGRKHASEATPVFGSTRLTHGINTVLRAKSSDTEIKRENELNSFRNNLENNTHEASVNRAYWNSDFMVHRHSGQSTPAYYMSFKMNSSRSMGAESFEPDVGYHNGGGVLQVLVDGDEYSKVMDSWDWHALPGLTEELRVDELPMKSDFKLFNPKHFAGVVSNNHNGFASFKYDSEAPYNSATANKSVAFIDDMAVALGSQVMRAKNGDGWEVASIVTTLDQASWDGVLTYQVDGASQETVEQGSYLDDTLSVQESAWFHQDKVGYVVLANAEMSVMLRGGDAINSTHGDSESVFHIAIDHGQHPSGEGHGSTYQYVAIPNVTAEQMPALVDRLKRQLVAKTTATTHAIYYSSASNKEYVAMAFREAGSESVAVQNGEPLTVSVSKPALILLEREGDSWRVSAQDPLHHVDRNAMEENDSRRMRFFTRGDRNTLKVTINRPLRSGSYSYQTHGRKVEDKAGQSVSVNSYGNQSELNIELPDKQDKVYQGRHDLYTGMPASVTIPAQ